MHFKLLDTTEIKINVATSRSECGDIDPLIDPIDLPLRIIYINIMVDIIF